MIIPLTVLVVIIVAIILLIYHILRKLFGCSCKKSFYPFDNTKKSKSVLPSSYTKEPSNKTSSSSSIYYLRGPTLFFPPSQVGGNRTPTPNAPREDDIEMGEHRDQTFSLDNVDNQDAFGHSSSPVGSNATREENHSLMGVQSHSTPEHNPIVSSSYETEALPGQDMQEFNFISSEHYESDV